MSGTFREWVEGSKVTEKHLSGLVRGMHDTIVEGLVISDAGGITIDISGGKALLTGYETRYDAVSGQSLVANKIVHVWVGGNDTFNYQFYSVGSETWPPVGPGSVPGYLLIAIVGVGAASIDWIWNNPLVRGAHVSEASIQVGHGIPDKGLLRGIPHVRTALEVGIAATSWHTLMAWPISGTQRGILKHVAVELNNPADVIAVLIDDEYSGSESASSWYRSTNLFNGAWPSIPDDFMTNPINDHTGMFKKTTSAVDSVTVEHFWTKSQFAERFKVNYYNSTGGVVGVFNSVAWEEIMDADMRGA